MAEFTFRKVPSVVITGRTENSIGLLWGSVVNATAYNVYRNGSYTATVGASPYPGSATHTSTGLSSNTSYSFAVSAVINGREGRLSRTVTATTAPPPNADTQAPTWMTSPILSAAAVSSTRIDLSCAQATDNVGVTRYKFERSPDNGSGQPTGSWTTLQDNSLLRTYSDTGRTASTPYHYRVSAFDAAANQSAYGTAQATTAASSTYNATHYVAPYASVAGASNDYADMGQLAFNASYQNPAAPCTLGTAMAAAVAGNVIQVAPGTYVGQDTGTRLIASFEPANSGQLGSPIIFFAQYPAVVYEGHQSFYSTLQKPGSSNPVIAPGQYNDYIIFDGFHAYEPSCRSGPTGGTFGLRTTTGSEFRRCYIDRGPDTLTYAAGLNGNAVYIEATINCKILDCLFTGVVRRSDGVIQQNNSAIEVYNSTGLEVAYTTHRNFGYALYQKESDNTWTTEGTWHHNLLVDGHYGINIQQGTFACYQNLCIDVDAPMHGDGGPVNYNWDGEVLQRPPQVMQIYNNTFVVPSSPFEVSVSGFEVETGMQIRTSQFYNNIIYARTGSSGVMVSCNSGGSSSWAWTDWSSFNRNLYWRQNSGIPTFRNINYSIVSGLEDWKTATSHEANSAVSDPLFVDPSADNFRLQAGSPAATMSSGGTPIGCYITGSEEIGVRSNPSY